MSYYPTALLVIQHKVTGMKYFCKTTQFDCLSSYKGSVSTGAISTLDAQYSTSQRIECDITLNGSGYTLGRAACLYVDSGGNYSSAFNITAEL